MQRHALGTRITAIVQYQQPVQSMRTMTVLLIAR
jgi:hypothetical protein